MGFKSNPHDMLVVMETRGGVGDGLLHHRGVAMDESRYGGGEMIMVERRLETGETVGWGDGLKSERLQRWWRRPYLEKSRIIKGSLTKSLCWTLYY